MASSLRTKSASIPLFLAPAFASQRTLTTLTTCLCTRTRTRTLLAQLPRVALHQFSSTTPAYSNLGRMPISMPPEVSLQVTPVTPTKRRAKAISSIPGMWPSKVDIKGPLGKASVLLPPFMTLQLDENGRSQRLSVLDAKDTKQREMWGTKRGDIVNHIMGVSEGHTAVLRLVGVGYRATVESSSPTKTPTYENQQFVMLKVGFSHSIEMPVPEGVKASVPQPTRIFLEGCDKEVVTQFAAQIRAWRRPEPYKGKGIFVNGETIQLKGKKAK